MFDIHNFSLQLKNHKLMNKIFEVFLHSTYLTEDKPIVVWTTVTWRNVLPSLILMGNNEKKSIRIYTCVRF